MENVPLGLCEHNWTKPLRQQQRETRDAHNPQVKIKLSSKVVVSI